MKKISAVVAMFAVTAFAGAAFAAGPATIELPASMGKVTFPHHKHQEMLKDCKKMPCKGPRQNRRARQGLGSQNL